MVKHFELYDTDEFITNLDIAFKGMAKYCETNPCAKCPFCFETADDTDCIASLLGEAWRREMNRKEENDD